MNALNTLYDLDYSAWVAKTAELLRQGRFSELDLDHLVEELDDMGKSQRHELVSRLRILIAHLLKWQYQYRQLSERWAEYEGKSWRNTLIEQRLALRYLLEEYPGLKGKIGETITKAYPQAIELAARESELPAKTFPVTCPYTQAQILDPDFYPDVD
ncbi:MAG: DUF29 domain-containing protein [Lamprobacter sp.]|uniref:DUF29 domain-containing protein n=1 Tax=Lamprobacter sp. TaxID=3100796 RepID=UPI002B25AE9B|nr:DUF29 domain-containing protein [Lamprobacter sp.]MEA3639846.1 DUF29 domain-containing protein [Lamprobacter sp.]